MRNLHPMFLIGFQVWMLLPDVVCNMLFCCTYVIMQLYYQFSDLPPVHWCYGAGPYDSCYTDVTVQNHCLFTFSSVICPLCTDVMVLGIMILVTQMLQCRIIVCLLSVLWFAPCALMLWCWALWFLLHRCYSAESLLVYFQFWDGL